MTAITAPAFPMTRGRRAALAIGVPLCLLLVGYAGLDLVATFGQGRYPVSYTVPASARALTLNVAAGQVLIRQAASGPATIAGTARYSLIRSTVTERTVGGGTTVGYHCPILPAGDCELDASVTVPAGMPVSANTEGGNATVTGIAGQVTLSSGGGNIAADRTSGPLTLDTSGGNIKATDVTSPTLTATTGGGDIDAAGVSSATISARTSGGNINATGVSSTTVTASSGGGNIEVVFTSVPRDVQVNTSGGNITLVLPHGDTEYNVNAHATGGSVTDGLTQNKLAKNVITATSGGGDIILRYQ
jgi:hypothetical protein